MKRPLCVIGLSFSLSTWAAFFFSPDAALKLSLAAAFTAVLCLVLQRRRLRQAAVALLAVAAGLGSYCLYYGGNIAPLEEAAGQVVEVRGIIVETREYANSAQYMVRAEFPQRSDLPSTRLTVRQYGAAQWKDGDTVAFQVELAPLPESSRNYYHTRGIWSAGEPQGVFARYDTDEYTWDKYLISLRDKLQGNLYRRLPRESAAVVSAMVLGLRDDIPAETYTALNRSGTSHLLAISGLHFSILSAFLLALLRRTKMPVRLQALVVMAVGFGFVALVGFSPSIVRAFIMVSFTLLGGIISRRADALTSLGVALLLICILWPYWTRSTALWLSAGATFGILLFGQRWAMFLYERFKGEHAGFNRFVKVAAGGFAVSAGAYVFTFPVLLVSNGWISVISPLANVLVTPFVAPAIVGGILCAVLPGAGLSIRLLAKGTDLCVAAVLFLSRLMSAPAFATVSLDRAHLLLWLAGVVAVVAGVIACKGGRNLAAYGALLCLVSFGAGQLSAQAADRNKIELVSLGQVEASLLIRGNEAVVLGMPTQYDVGELLRYLSFRGVRSVSAIVAPGSGNRISSGMVRLGEAYPVKAVVGPDDPYILEQLATAFKGVPVYSCEHARIEALGGALIAAGGDSGEIQVRVGGEIILKTTEDYDIMEQYEKPEIRLYRGGIVLPPGKRAVLEPVGGLLYGETRIVLEV